MMEGYGLDLFVSSQGPMAGCFEHSHETLYSIMCGLS